MRPRSTADARQQRGLAKLFTSALLFRRRRVGGAQMVEHRRAFAGAAK